jgi:hypothetical protein
VRHRTIFGVTAVVAAAALLLTIRLLPEKKGHPVAWRDLSAQVGPLRIVHSEHRLFRKQANLRHYLRTARARTPAPAVDFSKQQLLLVSPGPRSSTGYEVQVLSVLERDGKLTVKVRERTPGLGDHVVPHVTYPYRLLSLPAREDVFVDWAGR